MASLIYFQGFLVDAAGNPLPSAPLSVVSASYPPVSSSTNARGKFSIPLVSGKYTLYHSDEVLLNFVIPAYPTGVTYKVMLDVGNLYQADPLRSAESITMDSTTVTFDSTDLTFDREQ